MAKTSTTFFCKNCGASAAKWVGKCPACGEWNTYVEEVIHKDKPDFKSTWKSEKTKRSLQPLLLNEIEKGNEERLAIDDQELSRVLGGGFHKQFCLLL